MGKSDDPNAVLDSHARVSGVKGLRVADSSAAPLLGPGHPMATVCMYTACGSPRSYLTNDEADFLPRHDGREGRTADLA